MRHINLVVFIWRITICFTNLIYRLLGSRTNNVVGEFAECLVADALHGSLTPPSHKDYDMKLLDGSTVQIKARKLSGNHKYSETLGNFSSWNFDWLVVVLFSDNGTLIEVLKIDVKMAKSLSDSSGRIRLSKKFYSQTSMSSIKSSFSKYHLR